MKCSHNVTFIALAPFIGGAEKVGLQVLSILSKLYSTQAFLFGAYVTHNKEYINPFFNARRFTFRLHQSILLVIPYFIVGLFCFRKIPPSLLYCNDLESVVIALGASFFRRDNYKIIFHSHDCHNLRNPFTALFIKAILCRVDRIIVLNHEYRKQLRAKTKCPISVLHNSTDIDNSSHQSLFRRKSLPLTIGYLGQITEWKGVDKVIHLCEKLFPLGYIGKLIICGKPSKSQSDRKYFVDLFSHTHRGLTVEWWGFVEDKRSFFDEIDLLFSFSDFEPFGLNILETLSNGVGVVAFDKGGPRDILADLEGCLLLDSTQNLPLLTDFLQSYANNYHLLYPQFKSRSLIYNHDQFSRTLIQIISKV